jgi:hypothetical protein
VNRPSSNYSENSHLTYAAIFSEIPDFPIRRNKRCKLCLVVTYYYFFLLIESRKIVVRKMYLLY